MAYVDHAFSISDEDIMVETSYVAQNRPPIKEIGLAVAMLVFGTLAIVLGFVMAANRVGGDRAHGMSAAPRPLALALAGFSGSSYGSMLCSDFGLLGRRRTFLRGLGSGAVSSGILLHADRVLCLQRLQGILLLQYTSCLTLLFEVLETFFFLILISLCTETTDHLESFCPSYA